MKLKEIINKVKMILLIMLWGIVISIKHGFNYLKEKYYTYLGVLRFLILLIIVSCSNDSVNLAEEQSQESLPYTINNNSERLSDRIDYIRRTATITPLVSGVNTDRFARNSINDVNGTQEMYYWEHVAEVAPLVLNSQTLSATHITLADNKAYVSYHKQGNIHLGAVEIIDLSNPNFPVILSQASFLTADINAVNSEIVNNGLTKVWLAMSDSKNGAQLYEIEANQNGFTDSFKRVNIANKIGGNGVSASANGIAVTNDYLYITSGKTHGGTVQLNKNDLAFIDAESYSDAKYIAVNNSKAVSLVTGDNAQIKVSAIEEGLTSVTYDIGSIWHQNVIETYRGKSTMEFSPINTDKIYIAKGKDGLALVDVNSGEISNESKGNLLVVGNTNGVTADADYVYTANGSDGIAIAPHPSTTGEDILPVFYWDMAEEGASANYIEANGEWVFVAKGGGGFKILRKRTKDEYKTITTYNNNGKPDGMEDDVEICSTLLPNIYANVLPERQNAMTAHPEYFTNPIKNIVIQEDTELYLTFIDEGAGYKNVLGYYTYEEGNQPANADSVDKIVIFPNASAERSGGELVRGNTMRLLGNFEAGTVVSFFLIANGWRNGSITDGYYTQHTDINYNLSGRQQSILFYDATCSSVVIAFEDINVPNGDNDFNDAIFQISATNPNAINVNGLNQIGN